MTVTTPSARSVLHRSLFWIGLVVVVLLGVLVTALAFGTAAPDSPLSPDNPQPAGAQALVRVLERHGVTVTPTDSRAETERALEQDATLLVFDPGLVLDEDAYRELTALARSSVLVDPSSAALEGAAPAIRQAGEVGSPEDENGDESARTLSAGCALPAAERASSIIAEGRGYRVVDGSAVALECFGSGDDVHSVVHVDSGDSTVTVVGTTGVFDNERIVLAGHAALATALLGERERLVWYIPGLEDYPDTPATAAELTPPWVTPVILVAVATALAAAVWRGRRFGALVVERLPVLVPASETMEGRARLYARSSARLRAADALRIGTLSRLASACGLSRLASVEDVVAAVVAATGADAGGIRHVLVDAVPRTDRDLVRLSDDLLRLEKTVTDAVRPSAPQGE